MAGLVLGMVAMVSVNAETWVNDCQAKCEGSRCNTILGKTIWVRDSDGFCKNIEDAKSLKSRFSVEYLEDDKVNGIEVIDFNYSCITIKPYWQSLSFKFGKNVPFKIDGVVQGFVKIPNVLSPLVSLTFCPLESVLDHNYSFGEKSTTIQLQDANTENLEDTHSYEDSIDRDVGITTYIRTGGGDTNERAETLIKFNISLLPPGSSIEDSILALYYYSEGIDSGESMNISSHHVYEFPTFNISDQEWVEGNGNFVDAGCVAPEFCWQYNPISGQYNPTPSDVNTFNATYPNAVWIYWNVTSIVSDSLSGDESTVTIWLRTTLVSGSPSSTDAALAYSKEYTTDTTKRLYLNITYSEGGGEPEIACCTEDTVNKRYIVRANGTCSCSFNALEVIGP
jgi:hypothetical protein